MRNNKIINAEVIQSTCLNVPNATPLSLPECNKIDYRVILILKLKISIKRKGKKSFENDTN